MVISIRQYSEVYNKFFLEILKEGRIPSIDEVNKRAGDYLPNIGEPVKPIYKFKAQNASSVFDRVLYNEFIDKVKFDLEILFEELGEIELKNIQRILHADLFHSVNSYELKQLQKKLDSLLFATGAFDEGFFVQFDTFDDFSKTNQLESTPGIIDVGEGALTLPIGLAGAQKLDTSHLYGQSNTDIEVVPDDASIVGMLPGSSFGNLFKDSTNVWGVRVTSPVNQKVKIGFKLRLAREEFINKVTVIPHADKMQRLFVSYSVDDENIKSWSEYASGIVLTDQSTIYSMDVNDSLVDYIYIELEKDEADNELIQGSIDASQDVPLFEYLFGLKNLSFFMTGRTETGTYISKPFDFSEDLSAIGKIAISAAEELPEGTSIDWSVGFADDEDQLIGSLIPLSPQNRALKSSLPEVINIAEVLTNVSDIEITDPLLLFRYNSIDYYRIVLLDTQPIFGTAKLFRGLNAWTRDKEGTPIPYVVHNNWLPFSLSDVQSLYVPLEETQSIQTLGGVLSLILSQPPLYDGDQNTISSFTAGTGLDADTDANPTYTIYYMKLNLNEDENLVEDPGSSFNETYSYTLSTAAILPNSVTIKKYDSDDNVIHTFVNGSEGSSTADYYVNQPDGYPDGEITAIDGSSLINSLGDGNYLLITADYDIDITRFASDINGSAISMGGDEGGIGQIFLGRYVNIKYRAIPSDVVKASIKVKKVYGPTANSSDIYIQGVDYMFDAKSSKLQRLSTGSIPGGAQEGADVYCDFIWNDESPIESYSMWAKVGSTQGITVELENKTEWNADNGLNADTALGESFMANIPGVGLIDLTDALIWPKMEGWIQFFVESINPFVEDANGNEDQTTKAVSGGQPAGLIDKVIQLKNVDLQRVFRPGGQYFSEIISRRQPLTQVSLPFLKNNLVKGQVDFFAVEKIFVNDIALFSVIVNFTQNINIDLYNYGPHAAEDTSTYGLPIGHPEKFRFTWINQEIEDAFTKVIVKATLSRSTNSNSLDVNSNITPKVLNYFLKTGY